MIGRAISATTSIVDAHTHLFPPAVIAGRERYLQSDSWFSELFGHPKAIMVGPDELVASMDEAGIDRSVVCGWPWRDPGLCREHNAYLAEVAAASGGRIEWLGIVSPASTDAACEARSCFERGAVGLGELNADAQGFAWDDTGALDTVVAVCEAAERPLLLHASEPVGHQYPGKGFATPDRLLPFFARHPRLSVVAAHWGGGLPFYELMPEVAALTGNVVYDSAASTYLYRFDIFPAVLSLVGSERVLFASDYPVLTQPRFLRRVRSAGIPPSALGEVLGGNAERVFRLPPLNKEGEE